MFWYNNQYLYLSILLYQYWNFKHGDETNIQWPLTKCGNMAVNMADFVGEGLLFLSILKAQQKHNIS